MGSVTSQCLMGTSLSRKSLQVVDNDLVGFVSLDGANIVSISYTDQTSSRASESQLGNIIGPCDVVLPTGDLLRAVLARDPKAQLGPFLHQ